MLDYSLKCGNKQYLDAPPFIAALIEHCNACELDRSGAFSFSALRNGKHVTVYASPFWTCNRDERNITVDVLDNDSLEYQDLVTIPLDDWIKFDVTGDVVEYVKRVRHAIAPFGITIYGMDVP